LSKCNQDIIHAKAQYKEEKVAENQDCGSSLAAEHGHGFKLFAESGMLYHTTVLCDAVPAALFGGWTDRPASSALLTPQRVVISFEV
jgi:hypothetical protein